MKNKINALDFVMTLYEREYIYIYDNDVDAVIWNGTVAQAIAYKKPRQILDSSFYVRVIPDIDILSRETVATLTIMIERGNNND